MAQAPQPLLSGWTTRRVILATLFVIFVALSFWLLYRFYITIFILFVAVVLGTAIRPLVDRLHRLSIPRATGVILVYLLLLAAMFGFTLLVVPVIVEQVTMISSKLPEYYNSLREMLVSSSSRIIQRLGRELPQTPPWISPIAVEPDAAPVDNQPLTAVAQAFGYVSTISQTIFVTTGILLLAFYWTLDGERSIRSLLLLAPMDRRDSVREVIDTIEDKLGSFVRGQALLCVIVGVLALTAYLIIGLPYALVLALIAGVMEAVPIIGPVLGAVPPILLALASDPSKIIWVLIATVIIQQLESSFLVPRVMDKSVGVNPIMSLLSLAAFGSILGVPGALMAIPMAAVFQILLNRFLLDTDMQEVQPAGRDRLSILRYETQQLVADVRRSVRDKDGEIDGTSDEVEETLEVIACDLDRLLAKTAMQEVR